MITEIKVLNKKYSNIKLGAEKKAQKIILDYEDDMDLNEIKVTDTCLIVLDEASYKGAMIIDVIENDPAGKKITGIVKAYSSEPEKPNLAYDSLFANAHSPFILITEEDAYTDFSIVPHKEKIKDDYSLTLGMKNISLLKLDPESVSDKWNEVMNDGQYGNKVIGHEHIKSEIIANVLSGKHILLYGPPGTGKTMIASRISQVFGCDSKLFTANAEWTSDDTIGGYTFDAKGSIIPTNGYITEALLDCNMNVIDEFYDSEEKAYSGTWIIIDEMNRAKMDFAFGALFTALDKEYSTLNLPQYNTYNPQKAKINIPSSFKIIGTINNFDKNFLFKFSYALSRRFAQIYIGVPTEAEFPSEIETILKRVRLELSKEYVDISFPQDIYEDVGFNIIKDFIAFVRGYEQNKKIRDIGTALLMDCLKIYFVQKFIMNPAGATDFDMVDIAISNIIIPSLDGIVEGYDELKTKLKSLPKSMHAIDEFVNMGY